jgi:hypothetical protein
MFTDDQGERHETREEMGIERKLDLILDQFKKFEGAFARNEDGSIDFDGHRRYHEAMIRAAEEQEKFWHDLKVEIMKKGIIAAIVIMLGLLWIGAQTKFGLK